MTRRELEAIEALLAEYERLHDRPGDVDFRWRSPSWRYDDPVWRAVYVLVQERKRKEAKR
jgi:hypothetical protein